MQPQSQAPATALDSGMNSQPTTHVRVARFPNLRALAWSGERLYASRGYSLVAARIQDQSNIDWQPVARFRPSFRRRISVKNRFTARLFREGFHALVVLPSGTMIAAVPGSIVTARPGETEFHQTHAITRGTRPLHIAAVPGRKRVLGRVF